MPPQLQVGRSHRRPASSRSVAALAALLLVFLTACAAKAQNDSGGGSGGSGGSAGPGFSDTEIRLASSYPVSLIGADEMLGLQAYFDYQNKTAGGVKMADGKTRKINFKYLDDGYNTGRAVSNIRSLTATFKPAAIVGLLGSAINEATIAQLNQAKVPNLYSIEGDNYWQANISANPMMGPTSQPSNSLWVASELAYVKKTFPSAKVAVLLQNDAYGQDIKKALDAQIGDSGLTVAATEYYNTGAPSLSTQIAKLANSGADVFLDFSLAPALTGGIKYMQTINWKVPHFICYNCLSQTALGPAGAAADKIYAPLAFVDPTIPQWTNLPAITKLRDVINQYGSSGVKPTQPSLQGAAIAQLTITNLEKSQPTSQSLLDVARSQNGTPMSLLIPGTTVVTSPKYPYLVNQLHMAQYKFSDKSWTYVADPFVDPSYSS
jgi:branched-chain amino acid transport system substrate-binding protein